MTPYAGCPFCGTPVSVEGSARDGKLLHECMKHGWVAPIPTYGRGGKPRPDFDPRVDYPERYTDGPI